MKFVLLMIAVLYFVYKGIEFILPSSWLDSNPELAFTLTIFIYIIYLAYFILLKPITKFFKSSNTEENNNV